jgi:large conductance mechanosensitive channel
VGLWQEFKQFAVKGNVIDLAVGVIIGAAFGKITTSLVEDVIMPPLSVVLGKVDLSNLFLVMPGQKPEKLDAAVKAAQAAGLETPTFAQYKANGIAVLSYGQFINNVIQFLIIAFAVFIMIHFINKLKAIAEKPQEPGEPVTKDCPYCLQTIPVKATRCPHCTSQLEVAAA